MVPQNLQDRPSMLVRQGVQKRVHTPNVTVSLRICQVTYTSCRSIPFDHARGLHA
jgi:hypothetical protein